MKLTQIDLSKIKAIGHDGQQLGILFDQGSGDLEFATTPAPLQALEGILELASLADGRQPRIQLDKGLDIKMIAVDSSNIQAIGYAPQLRVLQVNFLNGKRYRYFSVSQEVFERFVVAQSKGQFLNREIKNVYDYCQVF